MQAGTIDEAAIRRDRVGRIRAQLRRADCAGIVLFDPINLRYATGSRNMQVWTMHNACRYGFVAADGPVILFELANAMHLARGIEAIDEIRPSIAWDYLAVGPRNAEMALAWAQEIADLMRSHGGGNRGIAIDRGDLLPMEALAAQGLNLTDGKPIMELARAVKSAGEIGAMHTSFAACADSIAALRTQIRPGMREQEALGILLKESITRGSEYMETRLLTSGPRTNPWFQETGERAMQAGDIIAFDTDMIGPMGFYTDISRSWTVGETKPSDAQRRLYALARAQLDHNIALLRPGLSFLELSEKSWPVPEDCAANRYADIAHGCGLGVEYPLIWYPQDIAAGAYDGLFEAGMAVCVESYIGTAGGREGIKLEQPVLITEHGAELLTDCPLEDDWA